MGISVVAHIVSLAILNNSLILASILRWWVLRPQIRGSVPARVSDVLYYSMVVTAVIQTLIMYYRLGQVRWVNDHVPPEERPLRLLDTKLLVPLFLESVGYSLDIYLIRGAFIAMYYDLFPHLSKHLRYALHILACMCIAFFVMTFTITFAWCRPLNTNWTGGASSCAIMTSLDGMNIITWSSIVTDIMLISTSTLILKSLHLRGSDFWALCFVYMVGLVSVSSTLVRYAVIYTYIKDAAHANPDTINLVEFWTTVEVVLGALAFVLPTFRTLARRIWKRVAPPAAAGYADDTARSGAAGRRSRNKVQSIFATTVVAREEEEEDEMRLRDQPPMGIHVERSWEVSTKTASVG